MFLEIIKNVSCQHNSYIPLSNKEIQCTICKHTVDLESLYFLNGKLDPLYPGCIATLFALWSQQENVSFLFPISGIAGIVGGHIVTNIYDIKIAISILRALNSPFCNGNVDISNTKHLFQHFMDRYIHLINTFSSSSSSSSQNERDNQTIAALLTNMKGIFSQVDLFDQYFNVLVPYVKTYDYMFVNLPATNKNQDLLNLAVSLREEILQAEKIRFQYARYCIPFDIVYVMLYCFLCGNNSDIIANFVFHMVAKICNGFYIKADKNRFISIISSFIKKQITPTNRYHNHLYYTVRAFRLNEVMDHLSQEFMQKYGELEDVVKKACSITTTLDKFTFQQIFPYILFQKEEDYYAFIIAIAHYVSKIQNGMVIKGTLATTKRIYQFVKQCILNVRTFENKTENIYWTKENFNLFLCTDSKFEMELKNILEMLTQEQDLMKQISS